MHKNFTSNEERVKQRKKNVMETAWHARSISMEIKIKEAFAFLEFTRKIAKKRRERYK